MCIIDCLSTIVFILPLHLVYTKVIILILWWRNFQLEYWRNFQLVSTRPIISVCFLSLFPYHVYFEVYKSSTHPLADKFGIALYKTDDAVVVFGIGIAYTSALYHLECCQ